MAGWSSVPRVPRGGVDDDDVDLPDAQELAEIESERAEAWCQWMIPMQRSGSE